MKDVLSLVTFGLGALCFAAFVTTVKPDATSAVPPPSKPEVCQTYASSTRGCGLHLFAAASDAIARLRR
jgi:hypothetical protein